MHALRPPRLVRHGALRGVNPLLIGLAVLFLATGLTALTGCGSDPTTPDRAGLATLHFFADLAGTPATRLDLSVTADDIPVPMEHTIRAVRSIASGSIQIPVGNNRLIEIVATDAAGQKTHEGSMEITVATGDAPARDLSLTPINPEGRTVPVRMGALIITIDPETSELEVGETTQLTATITDVDGNPKNGSPKWFTTNHDIASVDPHGYVTAHSPGVVTVAAEFQHTVGLARVFVAGDEEEFFVSSSTGSDANSGSRHAPFATIQKGIDAAAATGAPSHVMVAGGSYSESLTLASLVHVYGGHDPETWLRDPDVHVSSVFGGRVAVSGTGVHSATLDGLSIWSSDGVPLPEVSIPENPGTNAMTSIGIRLIDCKNVIITNNVIGSGQGAYGRISANRTAAASGSPGETGFDGGIRLTPTPGGAGGHGGEGSVSGASPGGTTGGNGGNGQLALYVPGPNAAFKLVGAILDDSFPQAHPGEDGDGSLGGVGGVAGTGIPPDIKDDVAGLLFEEFLDLYCIVNPSDTATCEREDITLSWGGAGQDGTQGRQGAPGVNGMGGLGFGGLLGASYDPAHGENGGMGESGGGGGGGGGAGGHLMMSGGSGGAGGGGGQGGHGGFRGEGGGGSFAILVSNSTGIEIRANTIITSTGGRGGDGGAGGAPGNGGPGGAGGDGGDPGELDFGVFAVPEGIVDPGGAGGKGGNGGNGGAGGAGGGGGGGPTVGILEDRWSQTTRSGNTFELGLAGAGGVSRGIVTSKEGNKGADGLRAEFAKFAGPEAPAMFLELELPPGAETPVLVGATGAALPE